MYKIMHKSYYDCFEDSIITILYNYNKNADDYFCNSWNIHRWDEEVRKSFIIEPDLSNAKFVLKEYYGIDMQKEIVDSIEELDFIIHENLIHGMEIILAIDMFSLPWSEYYHKVHSLHYIVIIERKGINCYMCADATQGVIEELHIEKICDVRHIIQLNLIENSNNSDNKSLQNAQYNRLNNIKADKIYEDLFEFAKTDFRDIKNIYNANVVLEDIGFIRYLLYISRGRLAFAFFLEKKNENKFYRIVNDLKQLSVKWGNFRLSILKSFIKKDWEAMVDNHQENFEAILKADQALMKIYLSTFDNGINERDCNRVCTDPGAYVFIKLPLDTYYNSQAFWVTNLSKESKGFDNCGYYYLFDKERKKTYRENGFDNISCTGQKIFFDQVKNVIGIRIAGSAECGNYGGDITLHGDSPISFFGNFTDWRENTPLFGETIEKEYLCCDREGDTKYGMCHIYFNSYEWGEEHNVDYISLPECENIHIFGLELMVKK